MQHGPGGKARKAWLRNSSPLDDPSYRRLYSVTSESRHKPILVDQLATAKLLSQGGPLAPALTPHGSLWLNRAEDEFLLDAGLAERIENSFARGAGHGLLRLGAGEAGSGLPASLAWWRDFAMRFIADLCALGEPSRKQQEQQQDPMELLAAHVRLHRREFVDLRRGLIERDADHDHGACGGYPLRRAL